MAIRGHPRNPLEARFGPSPRHRGEHGTGIRVKVSEIKTTQSRSTQGVKLIELREGDLVKTVEYFDASKKPED